MTENQQIYILNPGYGLKKDKNRVLLYNLDPNDAREGISDFLGFVHPVYAILLSLFDGKNILNEVIAKASKLLKLEETVIKNIITPLLENKDEMHINYDKACFHFPSNLLIKKQPGSVIKKYHMENFLIPKNELDLDSWRFHSPLDILFMINTTCVTNCVYCYADRTEKMDCKIPFERLKELVQEAKMLEMRSFDLTGGELFLYPQWEELLRELVSNNFLPYISTKIPITSDIIARLKDLNINRIQISIDSIFQDELLSILKVDDDYYKNILETVENLDKNDFQVYINTQVTGCNCKIEHVSGLIDHLLKLDNLKRLNIGAAGFSLYKGEDRYLKYRPGLDTIKLIEKKVVEMKTRVSEKTSLNMSGYSEKVNYFNHNVEEKKEKFKDRARCSANFYAFVILPDGKVTICEELYWNPQFIIGDLNRQSIEEVWNSEKAIDLYRLSKEKIRQESACKNCGEFDKCHQTKGVCWKEILYAYGNNNWDYPDPKCPQAPEPHRVFYLE